MAKLKLTIAIADMNNEDVLPSIPDDLIVDHILPRLPVKTLIRFQSLSKFWHSVITSPDFAISHLNFNSNSSSSHHFMLLESDHSFKLRLLGIHDNFNFNISEMNYNIDLYYEQDFFPPERIKFVGSCNGLVCLYCTRLYNIKGPLLIIRNPAMHQYHKISVSPSIYWSVSERYWFGYVPSIDDYEIVGPTEQCDCIHVFSLRTGKWSIGWDTHHLLRVKKSYLTLRDRRCWSMIILCTGLTCSWVMSRKTGTLLGLIWGMNNSRHFRGWDWLIQYDLARFFVMNGCLSLFGILSSKDFYDVWTMKQGNDGNSWEKLISFPFGHLSLQCITPAGKFLALAH